MNKDNTYFKDTANSLKEKRINANNIKADLEDLRDELEQYVPEAILTKIEALEKILLEEQKHTKGLEKGLRAYISSAYTAKALTRSVTPLSRGFSISLGFNINESLAVEWAVENKELELLKIDTKKVEARAKSAYKEKLPLPSGVSPIVKPTIPKDIGEYNDSDYVPTPDAEYDLEGDGETVSAAYWIASSKDNGIEDIDAVERQLELNKERVKKQLQEAGQIVTGNDVLDLALEQYIESKPKPIDDLPF